jgi:hypothetical protein
LTLFDQFAQSLAKVLTLQGVKSSMLTLMPSQVTAASDTLVCIFCGQSGHFIAQCLVCQDYLTNRKGKRNPEGKIVVPNGQFTLHNISGQYIKDRIDEWYKCNPPASTPSSLMYEK